MTVLLAARRRPHYGTPHLAWAAGRFQRTWTLLLYMSYKLCAVPLARTIRHSLIPTSPQARAAACLLTEQAGHDPPLQRTSPRRPASPCREGPSPGAGERDGRQLSPPGAPFGCAPASGAASRSRAARAYSPPPAPSPVGSHATAWPLTQQRTVQADAREEGSQRMS